MGLGMGHACTAPESGDSGTEPQHPMLRAHGKWQALPEVIPCPSTSTVPSLEVLMAWDWHGDAHSCAALWGDGCCRPPPWGDKILDVGERGAVGLSG